MNEYKILRTHKRPLAFTGELFATVTDKTPRSNRWSTFNLYRTKGGAFVWHIDYNTQWENERGFDKAESATSLESALEQFEAHNTVLAAELCEKLNVVEVVE